eukprot:10110504-Alexandrium_andersonii.AAC.1
MVAQGVIPRLAPELGRPRARASPDARTLGSAAPTADFPDSDESSPDGHADAEWDAPYLARRVQDLQRGSLDSKQAWADYVATHLA